MRQNLHTSRAAVAVQISTQRLRRTAIGDDLGLNGLGVDEVFWWQ